MASAVYTEEQLNYFRICYIATDILPQGLRLLFKQEWDSRYKATLGEWNDTPKNGLDFKNGETPANQKRNARLLNTMINGNRTEWDCTMLFYAILYSDSIRGLNPLIRSNVDELREFRNEDFAHMPQGQLSELDFRLTVRKVEIAFQALGLSTEDIQTLKKQKSFPTDELQEKDAEVQNKKQQLQISEEQRQVLEDQLLKEAKSFCVLPPTPPHPIASRDCDVSQVKQELKNLKKANANSLSYCYISGNPGSGKSQLASLVAQTFYEEAIKDTSALSFVMTLSAESSEALMTSYESLARNVGCVTSTVTKIVTSKHLSTEMKINSLKALIAAKIHLYASWLLVVDNVTSLDCTYKFLPESGNQQWGKGQLIITTQDSLRVPTDSPFTSDISISKGMEPIEARRFLAMVSDITDKDLEDEVAKALDYQPLALASAGTYVKQVRKVKPTFGWKDYLKKLEQGKREITEKILRQTNPSYPHSMMAATKIAIEREMNSEEVMKHAFTFLAFCAPDRLRLDILTNYILNEDKEQDEEDIGIQIQGSSLLLVEKEQDCIYVRLHQVVHDTAKLLVKRGMKTATEVQAAFVAVKSFHQFIEKTMPEAWTKVGCEGRLLTPHLKTLAVEIGNIFSNEEKYQFWKSTIVDLSLCVVYFSMLGVICNQHAELASAKEYFSEAFKLHKESEATDNPALYDNLGVLESDMGNNQLAKQHYERAISIKKKKFGPNSIEVATTYRNLGILYRHLGNYEQATDYCKHALSIHEKELGSEDIEVATSLHSLGSVWVDMGNYQLAKGHYERALSIQLKVLGPENFDVASTYEHLGVLEGELMSNYQLAKEHFERALFIRERMLGPDDIQVAATYSKLGVLEMKMGNHELSKKHLQCALSITEKKLGSDHVDVADIYHSLGYLQRDMGNYELAKQHLKHALSIIEEKLGSRHVDVASVYYALGNLQRDIGNYELAKEHLARTLSIQEENLGQDHAQVAKTYNSLGAVQHELGNPQVAKVHFERALFIQKKKLDPEHLDVACTHHNLGAVQVDFGEYQLAKEHYEQALSIRKEKLGCDNLKVAWTCRSLGDVERHLGNNQLAKEHLELALSILEKKLGHDNVITQITSRELCDVQRALESALSVQLPKHKLDDVDSGCMDHKKPRCDDSP